ncbi:hypothetical protein ESCO_005875 [Escovopsis weberi]|uniref:Uncharacterized protein n=1 Tax=Escovopsis weberi TaxID=150374 RepID=A0A0M9VS12_ESCWE|nr:hypothetical protein ESCO_005875 [Escovopsis weberi]
MPAQTFEGPHDRLEQADRCTSACATRSLDLKHQIVNLERLLSSKSDEVEKLKRRLEMVGKGGSPNEQLRRANDELSVLKEKAEATEKKMRLFERFTAKLRGIRDSIMTDSSRQSSINRPPEQVADGDRHVGGHRGADVQFLQRVRFAEGLGVGADGRDSDDSGMMADEAVVPARIRNCLHYEGGGRGVKYLGLDGQASALQGAQGARHHDDDAGGLAQVWSAVEELLKMDDQTFLRDWSPAGSRGRAVGQPATGA